MRPPAAGKVACPPPLPLDEMPRPAPAAARPCGAVCLLTHLGVLEPLAERVPVQTWAALLRVAPGTPRNLHPGFHPSLGALMPGARRFVANAIATAMRTRTVRVDLVDFLRATLGAPFADLERALKRNLLVLRIDECVLYPGLATRVTDLLGEFPGVQGIEYCGPTRQGHYMRMVRPINPAATCLAMIEASPGRLH